MPYLTIIPGRQPFYSQYWQGILDFTRGEMVIDIEAGVFTTDGKTWQELAEDHL